MAQTESIRDGFIATKLIPPRWDPHAIVQRARAHEANTGSASVVSIVGSAGSGKSTLMAQFHDACVAAGKATCWISLETDDNDPAAFASYLIAALENVDATIAGRSFAVQKDYPITAFEELYANLVARVAGLRFPAAIFFDDFQHVTHPQITAFINRLISHLPAHVQLFIASRNRLPLELSRARVSSRVVEVDQDGLNFRPSEAAEFLHRIHGLDLDAADFDTLLHMTEGWAAGLQLAAIALRQRRTSAHAFIQAFSGRDKDLATYLVESVLDAQPPDVRQFLLCSAPLRRMCADLCKATTLHSDPAGMLAQLEQRKLFVIPLDRDGEWFRYHHLFGEFLKNQLRKTDPAMFETVCNRAGKWCLANGMITEAIQYALDAERFEYAADLIADSCLAMAQGNGDLYTILDWMRRLPPKYHMRWPQICLSHAWARAFSRHSALAIELSDEVIHRLQQTGRRGWSLPAPERQRLHNFAQAIQAVAKADTDDIADCKSRGLALLRDVGDEEPFILATAGNCVSYCHLVVRALDEATHVAAEAYRQGQRAASTYALVWADFLHALANVEQGYLTLAQKHASRAAINADSAGLMKNCAGSLAALLNAEIACQRGAFADAASHMEVGRSFAAVFGPLEPLLIAYRTDARVYAWAGDLPEALRVLGKGCDVALRSSYPRLYTHLAIEQVHLQLFAGRVTEAVHAATALKARHAAAGPAVRTEAASVRYPFKLLAVRLSLATGNYQRAAVMVSRLLYAHRFAPESPFHLALTSLRAVALWKLGRPVPATEALQRAVAAAAPETCVYPVASCGRDLLPILDAMPAGRDDYGQSDHNPGIDFTERLVAVIEGHRVSSSMPGEAGAVPSAALDGVLTSREIEMLRLLSTGLPNKRLADTLRVSEATVKWHLHNINEKLGVANRTAAAAKARALSLI